MVSMGRRVAQKQHDLLVESTRMLLRNDPDLPLFVYFATTPGDPGSAARQQRIAELQAEFPRNTAFVDGRISNFEALMQAADYNCMPSLYEPHGGAYEGTVVPIARAVDGLAEQICAWKPRGRARHEPAGAQAIRSADGAALPRGRAAIHAAEAARPARFAFRESLARQRPLQGHARRTYANPETGRGLAPERA